MKKKIINYPAILNTSLEYIKEKIEFYNSIGLHNVLIKDTSHLITSLSLVYARYMFLKEKDITIDEIYFGVGYKAGVITVDDENFAKKIISLLEQ